MADSRFFSCRGPFSLETLATRCGVEVPKPLRDFSVRDVAPLDMAGPDDLSFFDNVKYRPLFEKTKAGACFVSPEMARFAPSAVRLLITPKPYRAYALAAQIFYPEPSVGAEISSAAHVDKSAMVGKGCAIGPGAVIGAKAEIGAGCEIGPNVVIGPGVVIGADCRIGANASLSHCLIGSHVRIYPGVRIGQDGFGFAIDPAGHVKVPQLGRVIIGDSVEIGANSCIDRGAGPDTVIGSGTWIDNLVQIGHNVKIGRGCVLVAQSGVAGSSVLEDYAVVAAQGGVAGHLRIGRGARIGAQAGVMRDVPAGQDVMGSPAFPKRQYMRQVALLNRQATKKDGMDRE